MQNHPIESIAIICANFSGPLNFVSELYSHVKENENIPFTLTFEFMLTVARFCTHTINSGMIIAVIIVCGRLSGLQTVLVV